MTGQKKRIGIMGGTFNPIHNSHVMLGIQALKLFGLDKVLFMPTKNPTYKSIQETIPDEDRCEMVRLAIEGLEGLEFSDFEFQRSGPTYTSDTLELLCSENPDCKYYFIIGADSIAYLDKWHLPEVILRNSAILCAPRATSDREQTFKEINRIRQIFTTEDFVPEIHYLATPTMDISSTRIRNFVTCGISIRELVPDKVEQYIRDKNLYKSDKLEAIKDEMKKLLNPHRYTHVISVADFAAKLALNHSYDIVKAYTAGLLHDCAKYLTDEESLKEAEKYGLSLNKAELHTPANLLHGPIGAIYAKEKYGIADSEILSSITYHTTGKPDMTILDKILYLADVLEYGRTMEYTPDLDVIRGIAATDLDLAIYHILDNMVPYLIETYGDNVCPLTIDIYNIYCKKYRNL